MARVLLAMSGGVDSSVSAVLLRREGHDVTGVFMRHGARADPVPGPTGRQGCCSIQDSWDARRVADRLSIPFYTLNFERPFQGIIDYFVAEYDRGRTPNPCIACNRDLKFGRLLELAEGVGAQAVATGHYARVQRRGGRSVLLRGADPRKDQSYVLFPLRPVQLDRVLFPVGGLLKEEVRRIAAEEGLGVADKPDSQEICFVPGNDHRRLLRERLGDRVRPGEFRARDGRVLGRHGGHQLFTVGQRKGLGTSFGRPMYVVSILPETNTVVLSEEDEGSREFTVREVNWIASGSGPREATVKIRHGHPGAPARVEPLDRDRAHVVFFQPQRAITPGQAAVFYDGDEVVGGGWIESRSGP